MKPHIEDALALCGRDRVMHREFGDQRPAIAIRWDEVRVTSPDEQRFLVREADTSDEAGAAAARAFADRLEAIAKDLAAQAGRIRGTLGRGGS